MSPNVILHIGIGSFHRAHQAWYLHRSIESGRDDWSLAASAIRSDMVPLLECLAAQHGAYVLETVSPSGERAYEIVRSIREIVPWDVRLEALIDVGARSTTRIVSCTVTESGYYLDDRHRLDPAQRDLATDLAGGRVTIYGAVAAIVRRRLEAKSGPVTLLTCDNLRANGHRFRDGLTEFLTLRGEDDLLAWLAENASFPSSMVDRITPRPGDDVAPRVLAATGFDDGCPVMAESFIQWVVEDDFRGGRPALEEVGVQFVESVVPYEEAKIRILNATHACVAWAGTLLGKRFIHEGMADAAIAKIAYDYITCDAIPALSPSPIDLGAYRDSTFERFGNPYVLDTNERVAADGYSKILGWVVPTLTERLAVGADLSATAALPALFFLFLERWSRGDIPFPYRDGVMDEAVARALFSAANPLDAFAEDRALWGSLAGRPEIRSALERSIEALVVALPYARPFNH